MPERSDFGGDKNHMALEILEPTLESLKKRQVKSRKHMHQKFEGSKTSEYTHHT